MKKDISDVFIDELKDMFSAEEQIIEALPKMIKASESPELKEAFENHLRETKEQLKRLKKIFSMMGIKEDGETCEAMQGLIKEGEKAIKSYPQSFARDAAIISKAQRIEHYEIAAYGTLRTFANELSLDEVSELLQESLDEEASADKHLTKIAEGGFLTSGVNQKAKKR